MLKTFSICIYIHFPQITNNTGEILQLLVRRVDPEPTEKLIEIPDESIDATPMSHTTSDPPPLSPTPVSSSQLQDELGVQYSASRLDANNQFMMYIPTTDPRADLQEVAPPQMTYPPNPHLQASRLAPLVYPNTHVMKPMPPLIPESAAVPLTRLTPAMHVTEAVTPTEIPQEPVAAAMIPTAPSAPLVYPQPSKKQTLQQMADTAQQMSQATQQMAEGASANTSKQLWDQAANLNMQEKLLFLKRLAGKDKAEMLKQIPESHTKDKCEEFVATLPDVCASRQSNGFPNLSNQDPFEIDMSSGDATGIDFKIRSDPATLLSPTQIHPHQKIPQTGNAAGVDFSQHHGLSSSADKTGFGHVSKVAAAKAMYSSAVIPKAKLAKTYEHNNINPVVPPVPMPRNLLMMEGAQSGANAVAIEMPSETDSYHGAATSNKEEDIAASGG